jgi:hypothetical protein
MLKKIGIQIGALAIVGVAFMFAPHRAVAAVKTPVLSTQAVFNNMIKTSKDLDVYQFNGVYTITLPASEFSSFTPAAKQINVMYGGAEQLNRVLNTKKTNINLQISDDLNSTFYPLISLATEGSDMYFKFSNLYGLANMLAAEDSFVAPTTTADANLRRYGLDRIENQWIKLDGEGSESFNPVDASLRASLSLQAKTADKGWLREIGSFLTLAQQQRMITLTKLKDERLYDTDVYHLKIVVNKNRLKPFLQAWNKSMGKLPLTAKELNEMAKDFSLINFGSIDLVIGKSDFLLKRMMVNLTVKDSIAKKAPQTGMNMMVEFHEYDPNQPVVIPTTYRNFKEVLDEFIGTIQKIDQETHDLPLESSTVPTSNILLTPLGVLGS